MTDPELEMDQVALEKPLAPVAYREIRQYRTSDGQGYVFVQGDIIFTAYKAEDEKLHYRARKVTGEDPSDDEMTAVQESMLFILAASANTLPA